MNLSEKYEAWKDEFDFRFIHRDKNIGEGSYIPIQEYNYDTKQASVGDGTINMAEYIQLCLIAGQYLEALRVVRSVRRLEEAAFRFFKERCPVVEEKQAGFFIRDDIKVGGTYCEIRGWIPDGSAMDQLLRLDYEDPCYSPFVSQDQVWNLSAALMGCIAWADDSHPDDLTVLRKEASSLLYDINVWIKKNRYRVINPYLSRIKAFYTKLPPFRVGRWGRKAWRDDHTKMNVKVKRGANNWYYSGGTKAMVETGATGWIDDGGPSIRTWIYKAEVWFLDRIWEPLLIGLAGKEFKHNSYYCYGRAVWYDSKYGVRLGERFNESIRRMKEGEDYYGMPFEWNVAYMAAEGIDTELVRWWAENYPEPAGSGKVKSPVAFLTACAYLKMTGNDL